MIKAIPPLIFSITVPIPSKVAVIIGPTALNISANALNPGADSAKAIPKGIIANPNAAINPTAIKGNPVAATAPNDAKPVPNAINPAEATAPNKAIPPKNINDGIAINAAKPNAANAAEPNNVGLININPSANPVKFGIKEPNVTFPNTPKNIKDGIANAPANANAPNPADPIIVPDID